MDAARSAEEGSRQYVWAAVGPEGASDEEVKKLHGQYIADTEVQKVSEWARSEEGGVVQGKVWVSILSSFKLV